MTHYQYYNNNTNNTNNNNESQIINMILIVDFIHLLRIFIAGYFKFVFCIVTTLYILYTQPTEWIQYHKRFIKSVCATQQQQQQQKQKYAKSQQRSMTTRNSNKTTNKTNNKTSKIVKP